MARSLASRFAVALFAVGVLSAPALAQQAYCSCCGCLYSPPGARWIGASRAYRGLCDKCTKNGCVDCAKSAQRLRKIYDDLVKAQQEEGQTVAQLAARGQEIEYIRQRWADLRYLCLAMGHGDIGRLDPEKPDERPSQGLRTEETKQRFRKQAIRETSGLAVADPPLPPEVFESLFDEDPLTRECVVHVAGAAGEKVRMAQLFDRFARDPPDHEYEKEVEPVFLDIPSARGKPKVIETTRDTAKALSNVNAYGEAYLKSFERYQGAERDGNKAAMELQERAMAKFALFALQEAKRAALAEHEARKLLAQLAEGRRTALAKEGKGWQDGWKTTQARLRADGWPPDVRKRMTEAGVPDATIAEWLGAAVALAPDDLEKLLAARRERLEEVDAAAKLLNPGRGDAVWPEPPYVGLLDLLLYEAQLLHAQGGGRRVTLPADDPFSGK